MAEAIWGAVKGNHSAAPLTRLDVGEGFHDISPACGQGESEAE